MSSYKKLASFIVLTRTSFKMLDPADACCFQDVVMSQFPIQHVLIEFRKENLQNDDCP